MPQNDPEALAALREVESELDTRWPETKIEPSTERIAALADLLGEPQRAYPVVHITGTNGKTSTSRMIDALFTRIGLRTGRYTSPHLQLATERISLDGAPISAQRYVEVYRDVEPYIAMVDAKSDVKMSKFEVLTGMAFAAFADAPVDVAVVEVGLGGRWDATNIADGKVAVVTPIDIDHTNFLGTDILGIAAEKAGIIKEGAVAVLAEQRPEVAQVLLERCAEVGASVARQGMEFGVLTTESAVGGQLLKLQGLGGVYDEIFLPLYGAHQAANAAQALAAVEVFFGAGAGRKLDIEAVREAFAAVTSPGRLERIRNAPSVFIDAAHNPHGARALAAALQEQFAFRRVIGVVSVMDDKDVDGILAALEPVFTEIVLTHNGSPRAMDADELGGLAREVFGEDRIVVEPRLDDAIEEAIRLAEEVDDDGPVSGSAVVVTGSVVTAGAVRALFGKEPQ
ncbi:folylpolyglutamate synthase/dihydrofolate synthase family protein [Kutzneria buriramensis]|uniref:Dihydrofolate synthase/folylpolyglutamate synthase n=1 Tax=Kutzneria buriramensis TaxID=1045776 RepID=A0A3E0HDB7_9PSEU|nr:folylpolyglutamate synthase/dihydrofolate synthase family protein [Kutzneria buriramensis]REH42739.1 dihydrofolate synthase/folylpolyglutamate synthase [Kutzneria buriramensis]